MPVPSLRELPAPTRTALTVAAVGLVAALVVVALAWSHRPVAVSAPLSASSSRSPGASEWAASPAAALTVDVEGRVRKPGLISVAAGSRVADALRLAGGVLPGTNLAGLNLARKVVDGEQILVGATAASLPTTSTSGASPGGLVNLNLATLADLDGLPGVGPVTAQRILDWRTAHGQFASVDQLREIQGIGEKTFARLKALVTV